MIFTDSQAREFVDNYLHMCQVDARFVYVHVRPVLEVFQTLDVGLVFEQCVTIAEKTWTLKWDIWANCLHIQNEDIGSLKSEPMSLMDTHLFKPMDHHINLGFHYTLLPRLS